MILPFCAAALIKQIILEKMEGTNIDQYKASNRIYKSCFVDVIRWDADAKKPVFKYVEDCEHCFLCMALCNKEAITVIPDFTSEHMHQSFEAYR